MSILNEDNFLRQNFFLQHWIPWMIILQCKTRPSWKRSWNIKNQHQELAEKFTNSTYISNLTQKQRKLQVYVTLKVLKSQEGLSFPISLAKGETKLRWFERIHLQWSYNTHAPEIPYICCHRHLWTFPKNNPRLNLVFLKTVPKHFFVFLSRWRDLPKSNINAQYMPVKSIL